MKLSKLIIPNEEKISGYRLAKNSLTLLLAFVLMSVGQKSWGQVSFTGATYTQNFNTLIASGSATWINNSTIPGWFHARAGTGTTIVADDGSSNAGNLYSYGTGTATDRALGSVGSGNAAILDLFWGVRLQNNTGTTLTSLTVSYVGEQWRNSAAAAQTASFSYLVGSPTVTGTLAEFQAAGVAVPQLDFTSPVTGGVAGALDGNLAANRTIISFTITGLSVPNGTEIMLRWSDPDHTGADHGLSIDDLFVSTGTPIITSNLADILIDGNSNNTANPGETIKYQNTITNSGNGDANNVKVALTNNPLNNTPPAGTTNTGNVETSALAIDDNYSTFYNTPLTTENVITNDFGLPSVSVVSFGATASGGTTTPAGSPGTTDGGGTLTVNANGTFSYTPLAGFTGNDQFKYIATTSVAGLPNDVATVVIAVGADITFTISPTPTNPSCNGDNDGTINFTGVSGGSGPVYTYSVNGAGGPFQASPNFTTLIAGTYTPAVKDGAGYIKTGTPITLTDPPVLSASSTNVNVTCNAGTDGSITVTASGEM